MATSTKAEVGAFLALALAGAALAAATARRSRQRRDVQVQRNLVGVVGGLGPKATALWYDDCVLKGRSKLFLAMKDAAAEGPEAMLAAVRAVSSAEWNAADLAMVWDQSMNKDKLCDQDHCSLLIYSNPTIAGRPEFMSGQRPDDPTDAMADTAEALVRGGATHLCMVCSTAHHFKHGMLRNVQSTPFLDMIELTFAFVERAVPAGEDGWVAGLMGTAPLLEHRVYERASEARFAGSPKQMRLLTPLTVDGGAQANFNEAIFGKFGIKAGYDTDLNCPHTKRNFDLLMKEVVKLQAAGAKALVLGCTELPLLLTEENIRAHGPSSAADLVLVNPAQVLADEVIRLSLVGRRKS